MKFWLSLVTVPEFAQLGEIARYAEELGFHGVTLADHLVMPAKIESRYPYTEDGAVWWPADTPWLDPWIALASMAAVTRRLRFASNIYLAALRDPFTAAKAVSTAAVLSGDRIVCGVSVGWIREEYQLAGVDFTTRGRRMDELIGVMRSLWSGREVSHHGAFFSFDRAIMCPAPARPVPVWCGGASEPALRRAARNDGWLGLPMNLEQLRAVVGRLHAMRREAGLPIAGYETAFSLTEQLTPAIRSELTTLGADNLMVIAPWNATPWDARSWIDPGDDTRELAVKRKALERFAASEMQR